MKRLHDLDGYVTGELTGATADAFEDAMFDAPDDPDLAFLDRIARHGATLAAHGTFDMGVPRRHIDELIAAGHAVQILDLGPPGSATITLDHAAEFIVTRGAIGRHDLDRVDVEVTIVDHDITKIIKDVLVDREEGVVYGLCERALAEIAFGAGRTVTKVRERDGDRAVIAEWNITGTVATLASR